MGHRFYSKGKDLKHRDAQSVRIIREITDPEEGFDAEVLPMVEVQFGDGYVTEVWPDELREVKANTNNAYGRSGFYHG